MQTLLHGTEVALSGMNPLDWLCAVTLAISTVTAFMRGFIMSLISLTGLVVAVLLATMCSLRVSPYLLRWVGSAAFARVVAFMLILVSTYLTAALLGRLLRGAFSAVGLGFLDQLAGAVFGFARGVLLLAAILLPLSPYLQGFAMVRSSMLLPYLLPAAHGISFVLPRHVAEPKPEIDLPFLGRRIRRNVRQGHSAHDQKS